MSCQTANWLNTNSLPLSCVFFSRLLSATCLLSCCILQQRRCFYFLKFLRCTYIYKDQKLLKQQHVLIFLIKTYPPSHSALEPNPEFLLAAGCCPLTFDLSRKVVEQKSTNFSFGIVMLTHTYSSQTDRCSLTHFFCVFIFFLAKQEQTC